MQLQPMQARPRHVPRAGGTAVPPPRERADPPGLGGRGARRLPATQWLTRRTDMTQPTEALPPPDAILQIRRAHASAKPTAANPAWKNCHHDMAVLLRHIDS